jgi:hypothetical protein
MTLCHLCYCYLNTIHMTKPCTSRFRFYLIPTGATSQWCIINSSLQLTCPKYFLMAQLKWQWLPLAWPSPSTTASTPAVIFVPAWAGFILVPAFRSSHLMFMPCIKRHSISKSPYPYSAVNCSKSTCPISCPILYSSISRIFLTAIALGILPLPNTAGSPMQNNNGICSRSNELASRYY